MRPHWALVPLVTLLALGLTLHATKSEHAEDAFEEFSRRLSACKVITRRHGERLACITAQVTHTKPCNLESCIRCDWSATDSAVLCHRARTTTCRRCWQVRFLVSFMSSLHCHYQICVRRIGSHRPPREIRCNQWVDGRLPQILPQVFADLKDMQRFVENHQMQTPATQLQHRGILHAAIT